MKNWTDIGSDVNWEDYGGKWARIAKDGTVFIVRFENGHEHDKDLPRYMCDVQMVDLQNLTEENINSALRSCGYRLTEDGIVSDSGDIVAESTDKRRFTLVLAEVCSSHGLYAPLWNISSETYPARLRATARRMAESLMRDHNSLQAALERPVNAIGSTAREYGLGDINSAMMRGNSTAHTLLRKLYGISNIHC